MFELIINGIFYICWTNFFSSNLLFNLCMFDLFYVCKRFIYAYLANYQSDEWYLNYKSSYITNWIDRLIIYNILNFGYLCFCLIFWSEFNILIKIISLMTLPEISNYLYEHIINKFDYYQKIKDDFLQTQFVLLIQTSISYLSKTYLQYNFQLNNKDCLNLISNIKHVGVYVVEFIKSIVIYYLMDYLRPGAFKLSYRLTKYAYQTRTNEKLEQIGLTESREILIDILKTKEFEKLSKPTTVQAIILIIRNYEEDRNPLKFIMERLKISFIRGCAFYFSGFIHPIIPLLLTLYGLLTKRNIYSIPTAIISLFFYILLPNHYLEILITTKEINYELTEYNLSKIYEHLGHINYKLLILMPFASLLACYEINLFIICLLTIIGYLITNKTINIYELVILTCGIFSFYNIYHLIVLYLFYELFNKVYQLVIINRFDVNEINNKEIHDDVDNIEELFIVNKLKNKKSIWKRIKSKLYGLF